MDTASRYQAALDYLYSFVDYSLKHASELAKADFNLERMRALMAALGNPQDTYATIHVAGTKGKGSVSALCASALRAGGYKTGLYTSPHLQDFCERMQVDGQPIAYGELADLVEEIKPAVAGVPHLTTFELTTALDFLYFARQRVDVAVIEVGLGGRLDATNIITPRVAVITSLSYDHTAVLGETLTLIAGEKAGIIKPGVRVVSSPQQEEALRVLERVSAERGCALTLIGRDITYSISNQSLDGQEFSVQWGVDGGRWTVDSGQWTVDGRRSSVSSDKSYEGSDKSYKRRDKSYRRSYNSYGRSYNSYRSRDKSYEGSDKSHKIRDSSYRRSCISYRRRDKSFASNKESLERNEKSSVSSVQYSAALRIPLLGRHQVENAATAYAALKTSGLDVSDKAIAKGFAEVRWPGRFEIVRRENPTVILDSAHNQDSFEKLAAALETYFPGRKVTLIFGVSEDKHLADMLAAMKPLLARVIATRAEHPRALEPEKIVETAKQLGVQAETAAPVETALARALDLCRKDGSIVLSAGSVFVTAEVSNGWQRINGKNG